MSDPRELYRNSRIDSRLRRKKYFILLSSLGFSFISAISLLGFLLFTNNGSIHSKIGDNKARVLSSSKNGLEWRFKVISSIPIKNISGPSSYEYLIADGNDDLIPDIDITVDQAISAQFVTSVVSTTTKDSITEDDGLYTWLNAVFVPLYCYVPLCNDEFGILTWEESSENDGPSAYVPTDSSRFSVCCALADTEPINLDEEDECLVNPVQSCRVQELATPCDNVISDPNAAEEDVINCYQGNAMLELSLVFEEDQSDDECCVTCSCYGDPRCVSFNNVSDIWILCDARTAKNPANNNNNCQIQKNQCLLEKDHDDNQCKWIEVDDGAEWTVIVNGSRCVPNPTSSESWITMYEFEDFSFRVRQYERGIIDKATILLGDIEFNITAVDCDQGDINRTWTARNILTGGIGGLDLVSFYAVNTTSIVQNFLANKNSKISGRKLDNTFDESSFELYGDQVVIFPETDKWGNHFIAPPPNFILATDDTGPAVEYLWLVNDIYSMVYSKIRCLRQVDELGRTSGPRLNIEALVEPEIDYEQVRVDPNGFCVSNSLDKTGTTANTDKIESGMGCFVNGNSEDVEIARLLCGSSVLNSQVLSCTYEFCEKNSFPNYASVLECVQDIYDGSTYDFKTGFCTAKTFSTNDFQHCFDLWNNLDYLSGPSVAIKTFSSTENQACAESADDLPDSLNECEPGVEIQYLDNSFEWVTYKAIPEHLVPCGVINFDIDNNIELFINPIRIKQCNVPNTCMTETTICKSQSGFSAEFILYDGAPTPGPTSAPLFAQITNSPSVLETEYPSLSPTERPTTRDEGDTDQPTHSPTKSPVKVPTRAPTTKSPVLTPTTKSPTPAPTTKSPVLTPTTKSPTPAPIPPGGWGSTKSPTRSPLLHLDSSPTESPTHIPTERPTESPTTISPTRSPSKSPTWSPSEAPTTSPTWSPSLSPTISPTEYPTTSPTKGPTHSPTEYPTTSPTKGPTDSPTKSPTDSPSKSPTRSPTTSSPTHSPTRSPSTSSPTWSPSEAPSKNPTITPTSYPTISPTLYPTDYPTASPTRSPLIALREPTHSPTKSPTKPAGWGTAKFDINLKEQSKMSSISENSIVKVDSEGYPIVYVNQGPLNSVQKVNLEEAGEIVFIGVYVDENAAKRELLTNDVNSVLQKINNKLKESLLDSENARRLSEYESSEVLVVACELRIVETGMNVPQEAAKPSGNDGIFTKNSPYRFVLLSAVSAAAVVILVAFVILAIKYKNGDISNSSFDL